MTELALVEALPLALTASASGLSALHLRVMCPPWHGASQWPATSGMLKRLSDKASPYSFTLFWRPNGASISLPRRLPIM